MNHIYPIADHVDAWPAFTTLTSSDVVVAAVSLTRLVEWCGTPCVHTADAAAVDGGDRSAEAQSASVVVTRVLAVEWRSDLRLHVAIDADLSTSSPAMTESRIIGREAGPSMASVTLEAHGPTGLGFATELPALIAVGDLIAIPCRGIARLHDLKVVSR